MAENRTMPTTVAAEDFIASLDPAPRAAEARALDALYREVTGFLPRMWGPSIIGYGQYAYRYDSGRTGIMCATGFSPRKAEIVLYIMPGYGDFAGLLARLGRHRRGKSCLYLRRLADADPQVLRALVGEGLKDLARYWPVTP